MGETRTTPQEQIENQKKLIHRQVSEIQKLKQRIEELEIWERFAGYLLHNCEGQQVYEESLQRWLSEMLEQEKKP